MALYVHRSPRTGRVFALGVARHPDRNAHLRSRLRLIPPTAPDPTKPRTLQHYNFMPQPFDQGSEGSCTANSGALAAQLADGVDGTTTAASWREYSREWLYYIEREYIGTIPDDSGADVIDEVDAPEKYGGQIIEAAWPYDANPSEAPPAGAQSATKYQPVAAYQPIAASDFLDGILTALDNEQPVVIGLNWFNGWFADFENTGILSAAGMDYVAGGHALTIKGYVPPNATFPKGAYAVQNSWGQASPSNPNTYWSDFKAGDLLLPVDVFAEASVQADAYAVVPANSPATLSVQVTPPASAQVGQPSAWTATVTGLPSGSVATYVWKFSDGGSASGATVSYTPKAAGTLTGGCEVSVASTGASAEGSGSVSVGAGPTPTPGPTPVPPTPTPPPPTPTPAPPASACRVPAMTLCVQQARAIIAAYEAGSITFEQALAGYGAAVAIYNACNALPMLPDETSPAFPTKPTRHHR